MNEKSKSPNLANLKTAIIIISDRAFSGVRSDETGPRLARRLKELGSVSATVTIIPDDRKAIISYLNELIEKGTRMILTSGGTGPAPSDVTPEATLEVIGKRIPGMEEHMRRKSIEANPYRMLSRGVVGIAAGSLIINLPGSPNGALENFRAIEPVLEHTLRLIAGEQPHN